MTDDGGSSIGDFGLSLREIQERYEALQAQPVTAAEIASADADDLLQHVWIRADALVEEGLTSGAGHGGRRSLSAVLEFEADWANGGLHQYFFNHPEPAELQAVIDGYRYFGLGDTAEIVERIGVVADAEAPWRECLRDGTVETFAGGYSVTALGEYDDQIEPHDETLVSFIRSHPDDFTG